MYKNLLLTILRPVLGVLTGAAIFYIVFSLAGFDKIETWRPWIYTAVLWGLYEGNVRLRRIKK